LRPSPSAGARRSAPDDPGRRPGRSAAAHSIDRAPGLAGDRRRLRAGLPVQLVVVARIRPTSRRPGPVGGGSAPAGRLLHRGRRVTSPFAATRIGRCSSEKVIPATGGSDPQTTALVSRLQDTVLPQQLTHLGYTAYVTVSPRSRWRFRTRSRRRCGDHPRGRGRGDASHLFTFRSPILALKAGLINLPRSEVLRRADRRFQWGWGSACSACRIRVPFARCPAQHQP